MSCPEIPDLRPREGQLWTHRVYGTDCTAGHWYSPAAVEMLKARAVDADRELFRFALSSALGWPGGISNDLPEMRDLLRLVAAQRAAVAANRPSEGACQP